MKTKELLGIIKKVTVATTSKGLVEGMDAITCQDGGITAYNDKISISYLTPEDLDIEKFSVNASDLLHIIKTIKADETNLTIKNDDLLISSKDVQAKLATKESKTITEMIRALNISEIAWNDLPTNFTEGLFLCHSACSFNVKDKEMLFCTAIMKDKIVATDKYRFSAFVDKEWDMPEVLLPYSVAPFIRAFNPDGYALQDGWMHFINADDAVLSCRIINSPKAFKSFKNIYKTLAPIQHKKSLQLPEEIKDTLDNMISFSDEDHSIDKVVTLAFTKDKLKCSLQKKSGMLCKYLDIKSDILKATLIFNAVFLKDILEIINTIYIGDTSIKLKTKHFIHILAQARKV